MVGSCWVVFVSTEGSPVVSFVSFADWLVSVLLLFVVFVELLVWVMFGSGGIKSGVSRIFVVSLAHLYIVVIALVSDAENSSIAYSVLFTFTIS